MKSKRVISMREMRIRLRLMRLGLTYTDIARFLGVTPQAVAQVAKGRTVSAPIMALLRKPETMIGREHAA